MRSLPAARWFLLAGFVILCVRFSAAQSPGQVSFQQVDGQLVIKVDRRPVATYVYQDAEIPRPYFAHVKAPGGIQVTRNHPPIEGTDRVDHDSMHPGIWMAFGDLDGADFWRNKAKIAHVQFVGNPISGTGRGSFEEKKHYRRSDGTNVCVESFRCSIHVRPGGYLILWDSTFQSEREFYFGDQEEMGVGFRVATPISEQSGGALRDSEGKKGAREIWSHASRWCAYSGVVEGQRVGISILCHPDNFRRSWMHARNYGFVAANAFGRKAMNKGGASKVTVRPGQSLRLRYGLWIHSGDGGDESAIEAAYKFLVGS